jgi:hypothetical protein
MLAASWPSVRSHSSPFAHSTHDTRCWLHAGQSWLMTSAGLPPRGRAGTHSHCESYCDASADGCVDTERMAVKTFVAKSLHQSHVVRRPRVHGDDPTATWHDRESAPDHALSEGQARWCARQALCNMQCGKQSPTLERQSEIDPTHFRSFIIDCFARAMRSRGAAHEEATDCMRTGQR